MLQEQFAIIEKMELLEKFMGNEVKLQNFQSEKYNLKHFWINSNHDTAFHTLNFIFFHKGNTLINLF